MIARPIEPAEIGAALPPLAGAQLRNVIAEAVAETGPTHDIGLWLADGLLEVYARDQIEAAAGAGGNLIAEVYVGHAGARCLVCGQGNPADPRPWCSPRCRRALRTLAREQHPQSPDGVALDRAVTWAVAHRNTNIGWRVPLTRTVAEQLYHRR